MSTTNLPPGPRGLPLIGSALEYIRDPLGFFARCARDYGDVVRFRFGTWTYYLLNHPAHVEYVLRTNHQNFIKDRMTRTGLTFLGNGLLTSEGEHWRRQRKLAQPAFASQQVAGYGDIMVRDTARMVVGWRDGETRNIHDDLMHLTLGIIARTVFDLELDAEIEEIGRLMEVMSDYLENPLSATRIGQYLPLLSQLRFNRATASLKKILLGIVRRRRQDDHEAGGLLARLMHARDDDGRTMTDEQLWEETATLLLAGHETTALSLTFCCHLLSHNADAAAKLEAELDKVLAGRLPTVADLPNLRFAEAAAQESMRLYPPAWGVGREALADCEIGGYHVPKGTQISALQWIIHRDPRWFDDPQAFRPERWQDDLVRRLPRCAYFPFGDGPRICIGNHFAMTEMILLMATIFSRFRLQPVSGPVLDLQPSVTLRPRGGLRVIVRARNPANPN